MLSEKPMMIVVFDEKKRISFITKRDGNLEHFAEERRRNEFLSFFLSSSIRFSIS